MDLVRAVRTDADTAAVSPKLRTLLRIAAAVRDDGRKVTTELVDAARTEGATDVEIHDTVLIAAAFCMFNRYVDGLGTRPAAEPAMYAAMATRITTAGYGA
jgi:alkylhydroperoxidase family enzyme